MPDSKLLIPSLPAGEQALISRLYKALVDKQRRNILRTAYYDGKNAPQLLDLAVPPQFARIENPIGWPAKAVDTLNNRCHLEGFVMPGRPDLSGLGVDDIMVGNQLSTQAPQVGLSSLIHAVAWLITTKGREDEPPALMSARDALSGTGEWNYRAHRLDNFLSILSTDKDGAPLSVALYLPNAIVEAERETARMAWSVERRDTDIGRVPVEPLIYKPRLGRPFGTSRISRPVMAYTNAAMRTMIRSEITAELYSMPQRVILGADQSMFVDANGSPTDAWRIVWGKVLGIPKDEDGDVPKFEQMTQATQEPHMAQLRTQAQMFAGETSIPVTELGIHSDANPSSAEAILAHQSSLIATAEMTTEGWSPAWRRSMLTAMQIYNGATSIPTEWESLQARFRNPAYESKAAAADAGLKLVQAFPWLADTDVGLELFVRDPLLLDRLKAERPSAEVDGGADPSEIARLVQQIYLGVGTVITNEEARTILRSAGAPTPGALAVASE